MKRFLSLLLLALLSPLLLPAQEWEPIGPYGGAGWVLEYDSVTGRIIAGGNLQIWRREIEDEGWARLETPFVKDYSSDISQLHATGNGLMIISGCCDPYFSSDGGVTWSARPPFPTTPVPAPRFAQLHDTLFVRIASTTLFASVDDGLTWHPVDTLPFRMTQMAGGGDHLYAIGDGSVARREGYGDWTIVRTMPKNAAPAQLLVRGDTILFKPYQKAFERSFDRGETWETLPEPLILDMTLHDRTLWATTSDRRILSMAIDGTAWTERGRFGGQEHRFLRLRYAQDALYFSDGYGVFRFDPLSGEVVPQVEGRHGVTIGSIDRTTEGLLVGSAYQRHRSADGGATWESEDGSIGRVRQSGGRLYSMKTDDSLRLSDDGGRSWISRYIGDIDPVQVTSFYASGETVLMTTSQLYRSTDAGLTWSVGSVAPGEWIANIIGEGDLIVAMTSSTNRLFRSTDHGATWSPLDSIGGGVSGYVAASGGGALYFGGLQGIHRSIDGGETWSRIDRDFPSFLQDGMPVTAVSSLHVQGDTIVAGLDEPESPHGGSLYLSTDRGDRWSRLEFPLRLHPMVYLIDGDRLLMGTRELGIYATSTTLAVPPSSRRVDVTSTITIDVEQGGKQVRWSSSDRVPYRLDLYTLTGEHVMLLADGEAAGGTHPLSLDDLPAGAYLCVLQSGGESAAVVVTAR